MDCPARVFPTLSISKFQEFPKTLFFQTMRDFIMTICKYFGASKIRKQLVLEVMVTSTTSAKHGIDDFLSLGKAKPDS